MNRVSVIGSLVGCAFSLLLIVSCSRHSGDPNQVEVPQDLRIVRYYLGAALSPPHHFDYTITLDVVLKDTIEFQCGYADGTEPQHQVWFEEFDVPRGGIDVLYELMSVNGLFRDNWEMLDDPPEGGSARRLNIRANGQDYVVPGWVIDQAAVDPVYQMVDSLVPDEVWDSLWSRRQQYIDDNSK